MIREGNSEAAEGSELSETPEIPEIKKILNKSKPNSKSAGEVNKSGVFDFGKRSKNIQDGHVERKNQGRKEYSATTTLASSPSTSDENMGGNGNNRFGNSMNDHSFLYLNMLTEEKDFNGCSSTNQDLTYLRNLLKPSDSSEG